MLRKESIEYVTHAMPADASNSSGPISMSFSIWGGCQDGISLVFFETASNTKRAHCTLAVSNSG